MFRSDIDAMYLQFSIIVVGVVLNESYGNPTKLSMFDKDAFTAQIKNKYKNATRRNQPTQERNFGNKENVN